MSGPVIGCGDAWELAEFYASLLGWTVVDRSEQAPGGWALVKSPGGEQKLEFQREEPFVPPVWPTVAGQPQMGMHLDIGVDGLAPMSAMEERRRQLFEVVERATSLGARMADHQPQPGRVVVMLDPAGHPFCLFPGSETGDGPHEESSLSGAWLARPALPGGAAAAALPSSGARVTALLCGWPDLC